MFFSTRFRQVFVFCTFWCVTVIASATVAILPSTQALSLLTKEVTDEEYAPLVSANVSPHDFSLKPSHIKRLQKAQLVVWLGPELEPYLAKVMSRIPMDKQLIINQGRFPLSYGGHPWTSPEYLLQGMLQLNQYLGTQWSSEVWLQQMHALKVQLKAHESKLSKTKQGYIIYHDGIGGFEEYFGLEHVASFTNADDQPPGAKHLASIAKLVKDEQVACVLLDHEAKPKLINAVVGPNVERITIDILAATSSSLNAYIIKLKEAIISCKGSAK